MSPEWYTDEPGVYESLEPVRRAIAARAVRPRIYYMVAPHLNAQTFVLSLRMIGVYLKTISREAGSAYPDLENIAQAYDASFPGLKDLRNSMSHAEDRLLQLDRNKKQIVPQPVPGLAEGGRAFFSGMLQGRAPGWTAGDGTYAQCEISETSLAVALQHVTDLMNALEQPTAGAAAS